MSTTSKTNDPNWIASTDALSIKEYEQLFIWLKKNAKITQVEGVTVYSVPVEEIR